jgi:hypothetical protein
MVLSFTVHRKGLLPGELVVEVPAWPWCYLLEFQNGVESTLASK